MQKLQFNPHVKSINSTKLSIALAQYELHERIIMGEDLSVQDDLCKRLCYLQLVLYGLRTQNYDALHWWDRQTYIQERKNYIDSINVVSTTL